MEVERKRSKGSFFNFFDWNGKSRKKLFAKDPEFPAQGTEEQRKDNNSECVAKLAELDEKQANSSASRRSSDFSCTSSITSDDGFKTKNPGVVARLMGLDSLPTSNVADLSSTPFSGSFSHIEAISSDPKGVPWSSRNVPNRPIERFRTEPLPRKLAKSIPITHNKTLSPIRSPGFVSRKNSAYIVEAAAKIIEASPKAISNGKMASIGSPSVPLRIRELKQKMEAERSSSRPRRSNEPIFAKNRKGQFQEISSKAPVVAENRKSGQVKSNAQRNINSTKQKERSRSNSNQTRTNKTLRPNNWKQNCRASKESSTSKGIKSQPIRPVHKVVSKPEKDKTLKKRPVNGETRIGRSASVKCNILNSDFEDRKGSMEVVSFTFTSPVKKAAMGNSNLNKSASFRGLNIIGADSLGALLEEKLRELTNKVDLSKCNIIRGNLDQLDNFDCISTEDSSLTDNQKWQGSADVEECSNFSQAEKDRYQHASPVSILEPSFESGSFSNTNADEVLSGFSANDTELSDSATSICPFNTTRKHLTATFMTEESSYSPQWELNYVRVILEKAESMLKDFKLGKTSKAIAPQLFHQLEIQHYAIKQNEIEEEELEDELKNERKVLFDFVGECLESISRWTFVGSCDSWAKLEVVFGRKEWLAKELWKEMLSWKNMGDSMVDELVDKDMSSCFGKWVDFDVEMFEEGVEIEKEIVADLVDELVFDILVL